MYHERKCMILRIQIYEAILDNIEVYIIPDASYLLDLIIGRL